MAAHPRAKRSYALFQVHVRPYGIEARPFLKVATGATRSASNLERTVAFGNPFPSDWPVDVSVRSFVNVEYAYPGGGMITVGTDHETMMRASAFATGPVEAMLTSPADLALEGEDGTKDMTVTTTSPTLRWSIPDGGDVDHYGVTVHHIVKKGTQVGDLPGGFVTSTKTELMIPPGILQPGGHYVFEIQAYGKKGTASVSSGSLSGLVTVK
jgi:hypothetical protein